MKLSLAWLAAGMVVVSVAGCSDEPGSPGAAGGASAGQSGSNAGGKPGASAGASATMAGSGGASSGGDQGSVGSSAGGAGGGGGNQHAMGGSGVAGATGSSGSAGQSSGGSGGSAGADSDGNDVFGIPMLKPSKTGGDAWNSLHWATGQQRSVNGRDGSDPTGWSIRRGDTALMEIDGAGVMSMGGPQPRFYVQPQSGQSKPFFRDIEFTGYYRRTADDGAFNAGFVVGIRAHVNGHGDDHCNASTYYLIFRNSGRWIFDKELDHPNDSPGKSGELFSPSAALAVGKWIGMKYLAYNLPGDQAVRLEAYIDAESNGDGRQPSHWKKVGETTDDGSWNAPVGSCGYPANTVVTEGGGVVFMRNTDVGKVEYSKLSWREIAP